MLEPTSTTVTVVAAAATASIPVLTILGVPLGIRVDWLMAGFLGALVGIILFDTVPTVGDSWQQLARNTFKRMFVMVASSLTAGYLTPIIALSFAAMVDPVLLGIAFGIGIAPKFIMGIVLKRFSGNTAKTDEVKPS